MDTNTYKKVIVSGNVIEVYEYERPPKHFDSDLKNDDYDPFDFENTKLKIEDLNRTDERRRQTTRDARNLTKRLALMNFNNGDKFITLTFDPKKFENHESTICCLNFVDSEFKKFIQRFNYHFKIKMKYIAVREAHKSGVLHFHMICNWDKVFTCNEQLRYFERYIGEKIWRHGFIDIKDINHVDNVGAYIIKYMTKDLSIELYKNKKLYLCSKGLKRPDVYRYEEAEAIIKQHNLKEKKEVFTNSYESEYNGKAIYKEFNLNRK